MAVAVYTKSGAKSTSKVTLPKAVFSAAAGSHQLIKDVYQAEYANERTTLADTKNRSAVRGGGRKPWRQKGTGRARAGTIRSPLWRGGGVVFGPSPNRNFSKKVNRATKAKVLAQALTLAVEHDRVAVIETLESSGKTKDLAGLLTKLDFGRGLIVVDELTDSLKRAANNLRGIEVSSASSVSVRAVMEADQLLITKPALAILDQRLGVKT